MEKQQECVCNVGVQECPVHPGRLWSEEKRKQFGVDFNARVAASQQETDQ